MVRSIYFLGNGVGNGTSRDVFPKVFPSWRSGLFDQEIFSVLISLLECSSFRTVDDEIREYEKPRDTM